MTIELHVNGRPVKIWPMNYALGPVPMNSHIMSFKQLMLEKTVLECKVDAGSIIYQEPYQMYVVVRSAMRPENIDAVEYAKFEMKYPKK